MNARKMMQRLWYGAFTLLGFTACGEGSVEYGTPVMDYQVKGRVTAEDGKPLEGIQVVIKDEGYHAYQKEDGSTVMGNDTVYTDADGQFVSHQASAGWVDLAKAVFNDVDGEAHGGTFKSDSMLVADMESKQVQKGDGGWYRGKYEYSTEMKLAKEDEQHKN